jgi:predicted acylesterase/phospholipase RssA
MARIPLSTAASALRGLPPFQNVSLRVLQDVVEFASTAERPPSSNDRPWRRGRAPLKDGVLWLVQDGMLEFRRRNAPVRRVAAGRVYPAKGIDTSCGAAAGHEHRGQARRFNKQWLGEALGASFTLATTVSSDALKAVLDIKAPEKRVHRLLMSSAPEFMQPPLVEALAHLLAAGIDRLFGEPAAVAVLNDYGVSLSAWQSGRHRKSPLARGFHPPGKTVALREQVLSALDPGGDSSTWHVVFVHPQAPAALPRWWQDRSWFQRIVHLVPKWDLDDDIEAVRHLFPLLHKNVWVRNAGAGGVEGPYFSSFIPTVIGSGAPPTASFQSWLPPPLNEGLATLAAAPLTADGDFTTRAEPIDPKWRLFRDRCRLRLGDLAGLTARWMATWDDPQAFVDKELQDAATQAAIGRWARAVTNRQVGVALSGGGASNAALIPLLKGLADNRVPIDVVSGVSGGALMGAYLCKDNANGLTRYLQDGWWFQLVLAGAMVSSWFVERFVDWQLGGARIEDLETRLIAVTTALRDGVPPAPSAALKGTLGEAVRVSGAAAGLFGPAQSPEGTRFLDGATALPVPARILPDFGADVVFAFNAIAGVREANLLRGISSWAPAQAITDFLYRRTGLGRVVDQVTAVLTTFEQASRQAMEEADVFYEVPREALPFIDGFGWWSIDSTARKAANLPTLRTVLDQCVERWKSFSGRAKPPRTLKPARRGKRPRRPKRP